MDRFSRLPDMIWESHPWKSQLLVDAAIIRRWASKTQVTERRSMLIERKIFLSAYAIRKLYESFKLSTKSRERSLPGLIYRAKPRRITSLNAHKIEQLYDLDRPTRATVSSYDLVNIIIHSLVYCETLSDDLTVAGFLITSDRKKNRLWQMKIDTFLKLMLDVGNDYPSHTYMVRSPKTDEFAVWQGHGSPPKSFEVRAQRILKDVLD